MIIVTSDHMDLGRTLRVRAPMLGVAPAELALVATRAWDLRGAKYSGLMNSFVVRAQRFPTVMALPDVVAPEAAGDGAADRRPAGRIAPAPSGKHCHGAPGQPASVVVTTAPAMTSPRGRTMFAGQRSFGTMMARSPTRRSCQARTACQGSSKPRRSRGSARWTRLGRALRRGGCCPRSDAARTRRGGTGRGATDPP